MVTTGRPATAIAPSARTRTSPLLPALFIATASNVDNLAVAIALGLRGNRLSIKPNLIIALLTMAGTAGAMTFGRALSTLMTPQLASALGAAVIIAIGVGTLVAPFAAGRAVSRRRAGEPPGQDRGSGHREGLSYRDSLTLGTALAVNNIGSGVGAGLAGVPPIATTILAGVISLVCMERGAALGGGLGHLFQRRQASVAAGMLLLSVGIADLAGLR